MKAAAQCTTEQIKAHSRGIIKEPVQGKGWGCGWGNMGCVLPNGPKEETRRRAAPGTGRSAKGPRRIKNLRAASSRTGEGVSGGTTSGGNVVERAGFTWKRGTEGAACQAPVVGISMPILYHHEDDKVTYSKGRKKRKNSRERINFKVEKKKGDRGGKKGPNLSAGTKPRWQEGSLWTSKQARGGGRRGQKG